MFEDQPLTEHFSLAELTKTDNTKFQNKNRDVTDEQVKKLQELARLLEHVRFILEVPLVVHSGYRCEDLNTSVGSSNKSQHLLCEAADFVPHQQDIGSAFRTIWRDIKDKGTNVGQLIHETAHRAYGVTSWLHISLGEPYRTREKSRQILRMTDGKYELLA